MKGKVFVNDGADDERREEDASQDAKGVSGG